MTGREPYALYAAWCCAAAMACLLASLITAGYDHRTSA